MKILNKAMVDALFRREAVLIGNEDRVPEHRATALFGQDAVNYAKRMNHWNGYGVGGFTLGYLTYRGVLDAASYCNVQQLREVAENYAGEETTA